MNNKNSAEPKRKTMKKIFAVLLAVCFLSAPAAGIKPFVASAEAQEYRDYDAPPPRDYGQPSPDRPDYDYGPRFSRQQLENLLAPVALYPDPLLAQIFVAATFSDQIQDAADFLRHRNDPYAIDGAPWDVSVKAVAHYPSVLNMMADRIDWTVALGQAYVEQPGEVMSSVQFLRWRAQRAGNLVSNPYQEVVVEREYIEIVPYRPDVIYVPVYEPDVIFIQPAAFITFGPAFPIGVWLNRDCDWRGRRVYYHGWRGGGWIERSRPRVQINNVYVNNSFRNVRVNREVVRRQVNVQNLNRFTSVNREANFNNFARRGRDGDRTIQRGADNQRGDSFRGRAAAVEQSATREDRLRRGRVETAPQSPANNATRTREERSAQVRKEGSARAQSVPQARSDTQADARENRWRRAREENRPRGSENRSLQTRQQIPLQPREARPRPQIREENRPQSLGNRSLRAQEERTPQSRENR
jgi:hypothetical protein